MWIYTRDLQRCIKQDTLRMRAIWIQIIVLAMIDLAWTMLWNSDRERWADIDRPPLGQGVKMTYSLTVVNQKGVYFGRSASGERENGILLPQTALPPALNPNPPSAGPSGHNLDEPPQAWEPGFEETAGDHRGRPSDTQTEGGRDRQTDGQTDRPSSRLGEAEVE